MLNPMQPMPLDVRQQQQRQSRGAQQPHTSQPPGLASFSAATSIAEAATTTAEASTTIATAAAAAAAAEAAVATAAATATPAAKIAEHQEQAVAACRRLGASRTVGRPCTAARIVQVGNHPGAPSRPEVETHPGALPCPTAGLQLPGSSQSSAAHTEVGGRPGALVPSRSGGETAKSTDALNAARSQAT